MAEAGASSLRIRLYRVIAAGMALGAVLALGELVMRQLFPQQLSIWDIDEGGLTIHRRNIRVRAIQGDYWIETNSLGMRDVERGNVVLPDETRVLVLGDSFMEAIQVPFEASFPRQLRRVLLGTCEKSLDIINASVSGWGTDDELRFLQIYGRSLSPDVVLLAVTLHNDISDNLRMEFHQLIDGRLIPRPDVSMSPWSGALLKVKTCFAGRSHLYQFVYRHLISGRVRTSAEALNRHVEKVLTGDQDLGAGWDMTRGLLDEVKRETEAMGARLVLMLIPIRTQLGDAGSAAAIPQRRFSEWAEERGVALVDLLPEFRDRESSTAPLYLEHEGHWTSEGHALASTIAAHSLIDAGVVPHCKASRSE